MKQYNIGIIGATGMVGQRFVLLTANHPWFRPVVLAASSRSAGKTYREAVGSRGYMPDPIPKELEDVVVMDAEADAERIASMVDFVFCAVDMTKDAIRALEERYARLECPVVSNNSAHRGVPDVPMVVPELNPEHLEVIAAQRRIDGCRSAPSALQVFKQHPAHHGADGFGKGQPRCPVAGRFQRTRRHARAAEGLHHQLLRDSHAHAASHEYHNQRIVPKAIVRCCLICHSKAFVLLI